MARRVPALSLAVILSAAAYADSRNQVFEDFTVPLPLKPGETLVVGIVGGWDRWDNPRRITRDIALRIRDMRLSGVFVETVDNHKPQLADELIRRAFPDPETARIIVFGQSLGGRETIRFCHRLNQWGYPIELAVVVDAVGRADYTIPANVRSAANLYQRSSYWPLVGAPEIRVADSSRTTILGNWKCDYDYRFWSGRRVEKPAFEKARRWHWMGGHLRMEYDPEIRERVRRLIANALSSLQSPAATRPDRAVP